MDKDQLAPKATEPATAGNMTVDQFAAHLASKRRQPVTSATGTTPAPAAQPESELAGDEGAQTSQTESGTPEAALGEDGQGQEQGRGSEGSPTPAAEQEAGQGATALDQEILAAIREAGAAPDRAAAIAKMAKRIASLVDDRDAERNRRLELERAGQPKQPGQAEQAPAPAAPVTHPKLAGIDSEIETLKAGLKTIRENREGYTARNPDGSEGRVFSPEELEEIRVDTEQRLAELSAERTMTKRELEREEQAQRETATAEAQRQYPWINQRESPEYQLAINELRALGPIAHQLKQSPAFALIVGRYVRGLRAEQADAARAAAPQTTTPKTRPSQGAVPPKVVPGSSSKAKVNPFAERLKAAEEEMKRSGGSPRAYAQLRSLRRQAAAAAA